MSSSASHPCCSHASASSCQCRSSVSLPEPAMIEATRTCSGNACLIRPSRGTHHSRVLSEISSQFHDEWSAAPGRFFIERRPESASARRNLVFGPSTLTTGCSPMVLVTTPPHPASNARRMLDSDSVGGAEDSRNGFRNRTPVNVVDRSAAMVSPRLGFSRANVVSSPLSSRTAGRSPRRFRSGCRVRTASDRRGGGAGWAARA